MNNLNPSGCRIGRMLCTMVGVILLVGCAGGRSPTRSLGQTPAIPPPEHYPKDWVNSVPEVPSLDGTLQAYLNYARDHHPRLKATESRFRANLEQRVQVQSLPDPALNLGYASMDREYRVGFSQMIPWPIKRELRGSVVDSQARVLQQRWAFEQRTVLRDVTVAYADYAYLRQAIELMQQGLDLVRSLEQVAMARFRAGGMQSDVLRAQMELVRIHQELQSLTDMLQPTAARLNTAVGLPADAPVPKPETGNTESLSSWVLRHETLDQNPELLGLDQEIEQARRTSDLAKRESLPDLMLSVDYMRDRMDQGIGVMLSITLPIWKDRYRSAQRQALHELDAAVQAKVDRRNMLQFELQMALFNLRDADRKVALYSDDLLPRARQSLQTTQAAYVGGLADFSDLIEASRLILEFELTLARANADRLKQLAEIEAILGDDAFVKNSTTGDQP